MPIRKVIAALLLLVFALNTGVGFACATITGVHGSHHQTGASHHQHGPAHAHGHYHAAGVGAHSHVHEKAHDHGMDQSQLPEGDDCCAKKTAGYQQADKAQVATMQWVSPLFLTTFLAFYFPAEFRHLLISILPPLAERQEPGWHRRWVPMSQSQYRIQMQLFQI